MNEINKYIIVATITYYPQCYEGVEANLIQFQAFLTYSLEMISKFTSCSSSFALSIVLYTGQKFVCILKPVWTLWIKVSAPSGIYP